MIYPTEHKAAVAKAKADQAHFEPKGEPVNISRSTIQEPVKGTLKDLVGKLPAQRSTEAKRVQTTAAVQGTDAELHAPNKLPPRGA